MGISIEVLMYEDMTLCTDLACHHVVDQITTFCHYSVTIIIYYSCSIFLVSTASCKAICGVTLVRTSESSQLFWLKQHALLAPHTC